ncbi:MAG: sel1 repeat family protein, partial [Bacilli bacterium]|nr:sel1 repeat family protein [Bacilli bacterium]
MVTNQTPKQLNDLGDRYFNPNSPERNIEMAFTYYKKAADLNNPVGYFNVGRYFIEKKQYKEASEYLSKAKDLGYTKAMIRLSQMYLDGQGFRKNKKKAFKMMQQATIANDVLSYHQLGMFYWEGVGTKKSEANAMTYFEQSANNKVAKGMYYRGKLLLEAKQIKQDFEAGFFWLDKAAENGDLSAIHLLIELYHNSHPYLKKKSVLYLKEMEFYYQELLAKAKDKDALVLVAYTYYDGSEVTKVNYNKAISYFQDLVELDHTKGYLGLGLTYLYGKGVPADYTKAKENLEIAQTRGDCVSMNALGDMYRLGNGVETNYQRAKDYYVEAAKGNETNALINLGLLHYRSQVTGSTQKTAFQYMQTAKEKGNHLAHYWLGIFYEKGIGTAVDSKLSEIEYKAAIDAGNEGAKYKYAQMLYENANKKKLNPKKRNLIYAEVKDLLIEYVNSPHTSDVNTAYSMYMLGELFQEERFLQKSAKISRYYFELSASKLHAKAMVRMYE